MDLHLVTRRLLGLPPPEPEADPSRYGVLRERLPDVVEEALATCNLRTADGNLLAAVLTEGRDIVLRKLDTLERSSKPATRKVD